MVRNQPIEIVQGGFSEPILQPCYLASIGTIFLLNPYLGLFWSTVVVAVPAFYIALKVAKRQERRDSVLREIAWNKMHLFINISDMNNFLRINKRIITSAMVKQSLNVTYAQATQLTNELVSAGVAQRKIIALGSINKKEAITQLPKQAKLQTS